MAAVAYWLLQRTLIVADGSNAMLATAIGSDWKGKLSPLLYLAGIALTFWQAWAGQALYVLAALLWLIPDRRIERASNS